MHIFAGTSGVFHENRIKKTQSFFTPEQLLSPGDLNRAKVQILIWTSQKRLVYHIVSESPEHFCPVVHFCVTWNSSFCCQNGHIFESFMICNFLRQNSSSENIWLVLMNVCFIWSFQSIDWCLLSLSIFNVLSLGILFMLKDPVD